MAQKQQNKYADIVLSCLEYQYLKREIILDHHSLVRIVSGEMQVTLADNRYTFVAGDTLLIPKNQPAMVTKKPKDGKFFKSVMMTFTTERLKEFYANDSVKAQKPHTNKIRTFQKHPLLESLFASLLPYFDLASELPENIISIKLEETIAILRLLDNGIDDLLSDFSEPGKINLTDFMEKHYMFNMTIDKFGHLTGRSLNTFKRDFQKAFNTTPQKWLTQKRLELAHYQLFEKQRKPADIYILKQVLKICPIFHSLSKNTTVTHQHRHNKSSFRKYHGAAKVESFNVDDNIGPGSRPGKEQS